MYTSPKCQIGEFSENQFWRIVSHLFCLLKKWISWPLILQRNEKVAVQAQHQGCDLLDIDSWGRCQPWKISGQDSVALHGCLKEIYRKQYQNSISERNHQKPREHQHEQRTSVWSLSLVASYVKKHPITFIQVCFLWIFATLLYVMLWKQAVFPGSTAQVTKRNIDKLSPFPNQQPTSNQPQIDKPLLVSSQNCQNCHNFPAFDQHPRGATNGKSSGSP